MKIQIEIPVVTTMRKKRGLVYYKVMAHVGPVFIGAEKRTLLEAQEGCAKYVLEYFGYAGPAQVVP